MTVVIQILLVWFVALIWSVAISLVVAIPVSILWNALMAQLFSLPALSYVDTLGLLILINLILGSTNVKMIFEE